VVRERWYLSLEGERRLPLRIGLAEEDVDSKTESTEVVSVGFDHDVPFEVQLLLVAKHLSPLVSTYM
jgi:hypothetical protein